MQIWKSDTKLDKIEQKILTILNQLVKLIEPKLGRIEPKYSLGNSDDITIEFWDSKSIYRFLSLWN